MQSAEVSFIGMASRAICIIISKPWVYEIKQTWSCQDQILDIFLKDSYDGKPEDYTSKATI